MNFSHIYIEKRVMSHPFTKEILSKFPKSQIIEIEHYKDKFNSYSQNFRAQKNSQKPKGYLKISNCVDVWSLSFQKSF